MHSITEMNKGASKLGNSPKRGSYYGQKQGMNASHGKNMAQRAQVKETLFGNSRSKFDNQEVLAISDPYGEEVQH